MSEFEKRLQKAIERGRQTKDLDSLAGSEDAATEEQLRIKHSELRNLLTEHIENCLRSLCDHFPGFDYSTVLNEKGWGARITRDDINLGGGTSRNYYSRLEILVRPFSETHILEVVTKGTIRNRESLNRSNFRFLKDAEFGVLKDTIDNICLEFAEQYSASH
ncbi:MAG: hypothetical protein KDA96_03570 [Planctomycetaceae bacterium]|nr:hypothetical protein [Planctomycetaceae bacterium]